MQNHLKWVYIQAIGLFDCEILYEIEITLAQDLYCTSHVISAQSRNNLCAKLDTVYVKNFKKAGKLVLIQSLSTNVIP